MPAGQQYIDRDYVATATAAGVATVRIAPTGIQQWLVRQVNAELPSTTPAGGSCQWAKNGGAAGPVIAGLDVIGGDPPVMLRPGDTITVTWSGIPAGTVCRAQVFYDIVAWGD